MQVLLTKNKIISLYPLQVKLVLLEKVLFVLVWFSALFYAALLLQFVEPRRSSSPLWLLLCISVPLAVHCQQCSRREPGWPHYSTTALGNKIILGLSNFFPNLPPPTHPFAILNFYSETPEQIRSQLILHYYFRTYLSHRIWPKIIIHICLK